MKTQMPSIDAAEATRQTERIVNSQLFAKAKRSQRLLRYLVDAALADPPQVVKEYTIATEIFDRDASYDPAIDATVRVEAGRLRSRLREYYGEEGKEDALLIELPKGAYRVVLTERGEAREQSTDIHRSSTGSGLGPATGLGLWPAFESVDTLARPDHPTNSIELQKGGKAGQWLTDRRTWRYVAPVLAFGLVLGYAGWRLARVQLPQSGSRSVAVLPLKNLSGDPAQDYFADGTTDELITELARVPELRVVSWNSVVQEKDTKKSLKTIAAELRADLLVEGSVSRSGDTVRINAQLIDTQNDDHLWANSFEGPLSDVMALENKAAKEIVSHAQVGGQRLASSPKIQPSTAIDPAAHDAYLRGRNYFDKRQARESAEQFQRAIDLSPDYASAYSGLAAALQNEAFLGEARPEQVLPQAMAAVQTALELDPENGDALIARGSIETAFLWRWDAAERDLTRGIALSPNNSYGHMMLSVYLDSLGKTDDAVRQMQQAVE
ncbi:TolB-like protein, partial [Granulicella aggregans]|nr:TolB-like protein [Granulicella aggregans]